MNRFFKSLLFLSILSLLLLLKTNPIAAQIDPNLRTRLQTNPIIVDHNSLGLFDQIPETYLQRARNIRVFFSDRSVGQNISESLDCMAASSWSTSPVTCRQAFYDLNNWYWKTYTQNDWNAGTVPAEIRYTPSNTLYNRSNINYLFQQGEWYELTAGYLNTLYPQNAATNDIVTYQFSYLNITGDSNDHIINDPICGFFNTNTASRSSCNSNWRDTHIGRIETLEEQNTNKAFIYWTTSLARGIGTTVGESFNNSMRNYSRNNHKILFDFASIISHDSQGRSCYDDRDGVSYSRRLENGNLQGQSENYPNDGSNLEAICQQYTVEVDNGHLTLATAKIRTAKAFWVLLAQIAGWVPGQQPITATPPQTSTPTRTPTSTFTPTPIFNPADANSDSRVDGIDYIIWLNHFNFTTSRGRLDGDFNNSGRVDGADYVIWINNYQVN